MASKNCSKCGSAFTCHANSNNGCWCEQHQLSTQSLNELKANFADCLCPNCLSEYQTVKTEDKSNDDDSSAN